MHLKNILKPKEHKAMVKVIKEYPVKGDVVILEQLSKKSVD